MRRIGDNMSNRTSEFLGMVSCAAITFCISMIFLIILADSI